MRKQLILGVVGVVVIAAAVAVGISIGSHNNSPAKAAGHPRHHSAQVPGTTTSQNAPVLPTGSISGNGAASFFGEAKNATFFIQWTRSDSSVSGNFQVSIVNGEGQLMTSSSSSFTGMISGNGLTLTLAQPIGTVSSLNGQMQSNGFVLTYPGSSTGSLINVYFSSGGVNEYNRATQTLNARQYGDPCILYLNGHAATMEIIGRDSPALCAQFVAADNSGNWTWNPQATVPDGQTSTVCSLAQNLINNKITSHAYVYDSRSESYGEQACSTLENNGWEPASFYSTGTTG